MSRGPKKLPSLRESSSPEELDIFQREVRKVLRGINEVIADLQAQVEELEDCCESGGDGGGVTLPIAESDVTNLVSDLAGKAAVSHTHAESDITGLVSDLAAKAPTTRTISTTSPLSGGGALSANLTLSVSEFDSGAAGVVPASGGGTVKFLRADKSWVSPGLTIDPLIYAATWDGDATLDGVATVLGMAPSGGVYTATRDLFFNNLTISAGVELRPAGFRIFVGGTLTLNGKIAANGGSTTSNGGGAAGGAVQVLGAGVAGGTGGSTGGGGSPSSTTIVSFGTTATGVIGGSTTVAGTAGNAPFRGGGGGGGSTTQGGSPNVTVLPANQGGTTVAALIRGQNDMNVSNQNRWSGGVGGGGGGGGGSGQNGGGGGGGGGYVLLVAKTITGAGSIEAKGGNGANGQGTNCGGGGGGGGGLITVVYATKSSITTSVVGGTAGNGTGTGKAGGAGADGLVVLVNTSGDGT